MPKKNQTVTAERTKPDDISKKVLKAIIASGMTGLTVDQLTSLIPGVDKSTLQGLMASGHVDISFSSSKHYSVTPYGMAWLVLNE